MELVCPYCSAQVTGPPPDGACPVCGESLAGVEPSVPGAPAISTEIGVVPTVAEEVDPTLTSAQPPVESNPPLEREGSIAEDTVVSGVPLLPPEPDRQSEAVEDASPVPVPATNGTLPGLVEFLALVRNGTHAAAPRTLAPAIARSPVRTVAAARPAATGPAAPAPAKISRATSRECPHCRATVVAAPDELCPTCGDFLDAPPKAPETPAPAATPVAVVNDAPGNLAALRECPHCKKHVFAAPDELCPECGDLLEGAPLVEDSMPPGVIEERDCRNCGARVVGTPSSACPACGRILGALLRPASANAVATEAPESFDKTFVGAGAAEPVAETQVCSSCSAEIPRDAQTCPACGETLVVAAAAAAPAVEAPSTEERTAAEDEEATVADPAPGASGGADALAEGEDSENTVAEEPELVLGESPGTAPREERFPSPKIPRSREQVSLPGRKGKGPAKPAPSTSGAKAAAPVAAAAAPRSAPIEATPAPPWQPAASAPSAPILAPARAIAAPASIGSARGRAANPPPASRRSGMLVASLAVIGIVGIAGGAYAVFGTNLLAQATPTPVPTVRGTGTQIGGAATPTETAGAPTPVARTSTSVTDSTPAPGTETYRSVVTPVPMGAIATPPPSLALARTPIVVTPPESAATPVEDPAKQLASACARIKDVDTFDDAVADLKRLSSLNAEAHYCLAIGYFQAGDTASACDEMLEYLRVAPNGPRAATMKSSSLDCQ